MPAGAFKLMWDELVQGRSSCVYVLNRAKDDLDYWVFATIAPLSFIISDELVYNMIIGFRVGEDVDEIIDDGEEFIVFVLIKVLVDFSFKIDIEDFDVF